LLGEGNDNAEPFLTLAKAVAERAAAAGVKKGPAITVED
jgi:hypothetical protein